MRNHSRITVFAHPRSAHLARISDAVDDANRLQSYFRLTLQTGEWLPNGTSRNGQDQLRQLVKKHCPVDEMPVVVVSNPFWDDNFWDTWRDSAVITVADWEEKFAPPALKVYLLYGFADAMLTFAADLPDDVRERLSHDPSIGCFFDACDDGDSITLGMVGANLCGSCESSLFAMGLSSAALRAVERILLYVRSETIRRPTGIPASVFIGHGHSPVWKDLQHFLTNELHLDVIEFNRSPVAGVSTTERLTEMLEQSCFAFVVMTGDDTDSQKRPVARPNVIHEAGFFQGRLGFHRAIILKEAGCEGFSNIDGLTYIDFPALKILTATTKRQICETLEREGLISQSVASAARPTTKRQNGRRPKAR